MKSPLDAALSDQPAVELVQPEATSTPLPGWLLRASASQSPGLPPKGEEKGSPSKAEEAGETPALRESPAALEPPAAPLPASPALPPEGGEKAGQVPLSSLLDEREQRQAAQKALKELQDRLARERADWQAKNPPTEGQVLEAQRYADNLRFSRRFAEREYGKDLVQKVHEWVVAQCDADPRFNEQMRSSDDPYEAAVQAFHREEILRQVTPADLEAFNAWKAALAQATASSPSSSGDAALPFGGRPPGSSGDAALPFGGRPPETTLPRQGGGEDKFPPTPAAPPRSLATAPGNGGLGQSAVSVGEGEAFRTALG